MRFFSPWKYTVDAASVALLERTGWRLPDPERAPTGAEELKHPEPDFYTVGMKSCGRAPTFLLLTGYEQVRSVVAAIAGDWESARNVELVLPETGVCSTSNSGGESDACCGTTGAAAPPAFNQTDALYELEIPLLPRRWHRR